MEEYIRQSSLYALLRETFNADLVRILLTIIALFILSGWAGHLPRG
jgi:hypothetical protein